MRRARFVAAVAVGGAVGAAARYGLAVAWPVPRGGLPWATLTANALGCLLLGALVAALDSMTDPPPLARPMLGTGVLGGFTTFSTYLLDCGRLLAADRPVAAAAYLVGTLAAGLVAVWTGATAVRSVTRGGGGR